MDASRSNDASPSAVGFIGDLNDSWIAAIADAVAAHRLVHRIDCAGALPERPFAEVGRPRALVVHRHALGATDVERLEEWRARASGPPSVLILVVSPYVRYESLDRWSKLVDVVVSEATAADVLPGRLARMIDGRGRRQPPDGTPVCQIELAGGDDALCRALADACASAGYAARVVGENEVGGNPPPRRRERSRSTGRTLTIWEVPVLEPDWPHRIEWRARQNGPVIALAGFADRAVVSRAKSAGAVACLELPCELDDLVDAVDRTVIESPPESWPISGSVEPARVLPPRRRDTRRRERVLAPSTWPDRGPLPRIS
jgi:hypothetical protein